MKAKEKINLSDNMVSIVMPSFNTALYIARAIRSVQVQTYTNWELIIVDDCSSDNTDEVVFPFLRDKRIKYIRNLKNQGAALSRNTALRQARGRWIAFLDSDDVWAKNKLEKQLNFMLRNDYHFSYTRYEEIDEKSERTGVVVSGPRHITKRKMYEYCWPGCLTVMYDRSLVGNLQIIDIKKNNDYAIWLKVIEKTDCFLFDKCLVLYRRGRTGSISTQGYITMIRWHYRLFRENGNNIFLAGIRTVRNLFFGILKKIVYVKKEIR